MNVNKEEENENNISIDCSKNFSMIKKAFTEIDDFSCYSLIYLNEDNLNENNKNDDNYNIFINKIII